DAERLKGQNQRLGAIAHADRHGYAEILRELVLEGPDSVSENKPGRVQDRAYRLVDLRSNRRHLAREVEDGDVHTVAVGRPGCFGRRSSGRNRDGTPTRNSLSRTQSRSRSTPTFATRRKLKN